MLSNLSLTSSLHISLSLWPVSSLVKASSFLFWFVTVTICYFPWSSIVFACFSNVLLRGEYGNFSCSFILLWSEDSISTLVRYSYSLILPGDNADIFAAFLLISYCNFSSLILSSVVMTNFYIVSKRFFLKRGALFDERVVSITKKEYG